MTFVDLVCEEGEDALLVAHVSGEIDMSNAGTLRVSLERRIDNLASGVVLDLSDVSYIDSAGIHLLYQLAERIAGRGRELRIVVAEDSPVQDTLHYAGALGSIRTARTVAEAEQALARAGD